MIDILIFLLVPALKATDAGSRNPLHIVAALVAWPLDMLIARTSWRGIAGPLHKGERTISDSLERLCHPSNCDHPDYEWFVQTGLKINRASPTGRHIIVLTPRQEVDTQPDLLEERKKRQLLFW